jgi:hypothetical protein
MKRSKHQELQRNSNFQVPTIWLTLTIRGLVLDVSLELGVWSLELLNYAQTL